MPIYHELVRQWRAAGRTVPGRPDPAWESLTAPRSAGCRRPPAEAGHREAAGVRRPG
ncbi:hypothetical protein [Kitasatospora terrestris]|uniref:hypothetical protein n=1 Tax=Kitasatospora terrestris TaxID=258051 RepID=UPI0031E5D139